MTPCRAGLIVPFAASLLLHAVLVFSLSRMDQAWGELPVATPLVVSLKRLSATASPKKSQNPPGSMPRSQNIPSPAATVAEPRATLSSVGSPEKPVLAPPMAVSAETALPKSVVPSPPGAKSTRPRPKHAATTDPLATAPPTPDSPAKLMTNLPATEPSTSSGSAVATVDATGTPNRRQASFGEVGGPHLLFMPELRYPERARRLNLEGQVLLLLELDNTGRLEKTSVLQSAGYGFDEVAMQAVVKARFAPAEQQGQPIACQAKLPIRFRLNPPR